MKAIQCLSGLRVQDYLLFIPSHGGCKTKAIIKAPEIKLRILLFPADEILRFLLPFCSLFGSWSPNSYRRFKFPQAVKALKHWPSTSCPSALTTRYQSPVFAVFRKTFQMNSWLLQCWYVGPNLGFRSDYRRCLPSHWLRKEWGFSGGTVLIRELSIGAFYPVQSWINLVPCSWSWVLEEGEPKADAIQSDWRRETHWDSLGHGVIFKCTNLSH